MSEPDPIEDGPWGIKKIPGRERQMAIEAAKRAKLTVGEWLAEAIRAHVEDERVDARDIDVLPPGTSPRSAEMSAHPLAVSPLSVSEIGESIEIAQRIASLRGRDVPVRLLTGAMRVLNRRINASGVCPECARLLGAHPQMVSPPREQRAQHIDHPRVGEPQRSPAVRPAGQGDVHAG